jgi:phage terminase large subunit
MQRKQRALCCREIQKSIKESVHQLLANQIVALGLQDFYTVLNTEIRGRRGTIFGFAGLRFNASGLKSYEDADVAWVEEGQAVSKPSWGILIPTIRNEGSEIWVSFNPEFEDDDTYTRFVVHPPKNSIIVEVNWRDNPWFPDVLEQERLELKERDLAEYDHVWEGKCRRWLEGAIYANELRAAYDQGRITKVAYDKNAKVYTAWDLGRTDDTAIWWYQLVGGEIHIIESYAESGGSPSEFATQVLGRKTTIDIVRGELKVTVGDPVPELAHRTRYDYVTHWLPHDARAKTLAAHGKSTQQQLQEALGYGEVRIVSNLSVEDGINAARTSFPRCWFDSDKTADGLKALRKYRRELKEDEVSLSKAPKHDWTSHYADAFRYLAIAWQEERLPVDEQRKKRDPYGQDDDEAENWKTA